MAISFLEKADRIPPPLVWLIARDNRRPIQLNEIARRCGLSRWTLRKIFTLPSWRTVPIWQVDAIRMACGITSSNQFRHVEYLKRSLTRDADTLVHLYKRTPCARIAFNKILGRPDVAKQLSRLSVAGAGSSSAHRPPRVTTVGAALQLTSHPPSPSGDKPLDDKP